MYLCIERAQRGWAAIHLPIHSFGWLAVRSRPLLATRAVHKGAHHSDRAGAALLQKLHAGDKMRPDAPVQPHLDNASRVFGGVHHGPALPNRMASGLLHKHMRSRLQRCNPNERMPMVRSRDDDDLWFFLVEQFAEIAIFLRLIA